MKIQKFMRKAAGSISASSHPVKAPNLRSVIKSVIKLEEFSTYVKMLQHLPFNYVKTGNLLFESIFALNLDFFVLYYAPIEECEQGAA